MPCPRTSFRTPGGPRACLDSRAFGGKRREACIYVRCQRRLGDSPTEGIGILLRAVCNSGLLWNFLAPRRPIVLSRYEYTQRYFVACEVREYEKKERGGGVRERDIKEKEQRARESCPRRRRSADGGPRNSRGTRRNTLSRRRLGYSRASAVVTQRCRIVVVLPHSYAKESCRNECVRACMSVDSVTRAPYISHVETAGTSPR